MDAFVLKAGQLKHGLCPGVQQDVYFPGFPTLKHIEHTVRLPTCIAVPLWLLINNHL